jgi:hypothetical protein
MIHDVDGPDSAFYRCSIGEVIEVRRRIHFLAVLVLLAIGSLAMIGAVPLQSGVPPQPYNADLFSGRVYLGPDLAPPGTRMLACVDVCCVFETEVFTLDPDGSYKLLAIHPADRSLRGRPISFYLLNQHGRIKAAEITYFEGGFNAVDLDLHFEGPLPSPPVAPDLPRVGDPLVPQLPRVALGMGSLLLAAGLLLMLIRGTSATRGTQ